jgi:hypothetical protein
MRAESLFRLDRATDAGAPRRRARGNRLYTWGAVAALLIIFVGFGRTFFLRGLYGGPALSPLLLVHGIVMTAWLVVFIAQAWLAGAGRIRVHRKLGVFGAVIALLVLCVGVIAAIDAGRRGASPSAAVPPLMFMAIPLFDMPVFAILVGVALWQRNRPDIHKRLMLLATLSLLTPGIGRLPIAVIQQGGPPVFFGLALSIVLLGIAIDSAINRRLHPAFFWGGALILAMLPLRLLVATSEWWHGMARWLIG